MLCEGAALNADGTLTLTRVLDEIAIAAHPRQSFPSTVRVTAVVALRSSTEIHEGALVVVAREPSGQQGEVAAFDARLDPTQPHLAQIIPLTLLVHRPGEYWFDVLWDTTVISRMRLAVRAIPVA